MTLNLALILLLVAVIALVIALLIAVSTFSGNEGAWLAGGLLAYVSSKLAEKLP